MAFRCWGSICKLCRDKKPKYVFSIHLKFHLNQFCIKPIEMLSYLFSQEQLMVSMEWKQASEIAVRNLPEGVWAGAWSNCSNWKTQTYQWLIKGNSSAIPLIQMNQTLQPNSLQLNEKYSNRQSSTSHRSAWESFTWCTLKGWGFPQVQQDRNRKKVSGFDL